MKSYPLLQLKVQKQLAVLVWRKAGQGGKTQAVRAQQRYCRKPLEISVSSVAIISSTDSVGKQLKRREAELLYIPSCDLSALFWSQIKNLCETDVAPMEVNGIISGLNIFPVHFLWSRMDHRAFFPDRSSSMYCCTFSQLYRSFLLCLLSCLSIIWEHCAVTISLMLIQCLPCCFILLRLAAFPSMQARVCVCWHIAVISVFILVFNILNIFIVAGFWKKGSFLYVISFCVASIETKDLLLKHVIDGQVFKNISAPSLLQICLLWCPNQNTELFSRSGSHSPIFLQQTDHLPSIVFTSVLQYVL